MRTRLLAATAALALGTVAQAQEAPTVAGIIFQNDMFFRMIQLGMEAQAAAGAELLMGNSEAKPDKEAQLIDTCISRASTRSWCPRSRPWPRPPRSSGPRRRASRW